MFCGTGQHLFMGEFMNLQQYIARLFFASTCLFFAAKSHATVRYVDTAATGSESGADWANAYTTLQPAITASSLGDQVWVKAGTYRPTTTSNRSIRFELKDGVKVFGGFAGTETPPFDPETDPRDFVTNETILSGDIDTDGILDGDNSYTVVYAGGSVTEQAWLDGFTVRDGYGGTDIGDYQVGAGIYCTTNASPTVRNCVITNNTIPTGDGLGAGFYGQTCLSNFLNCRFESNAAGFFGGGMYIDLNSRPQLDFCYFGDAADSGTGNVAVQKGGGRGGGSAMHGGTAVGKNPGFSGRDT